MENYDWFSCGMTSCVLHIYTWDNMTDYCKAALSQHNITSLIRILKCHPSISLVLLRRLVWLIFFFIICLSYIFLAFLNMQWCSCTPTDWTTCLMRALPLCNYAQNVSFKRCVSVARCRQREKRMQDKKIVTKLFLKYLQIFRHRLVQISTESMCGPRFFFS